MDRKTLAAIEKILAKSPDWLAFQAGEQERFYFIVECHRVIRELMKKS